MSLRREIFRKLGKAFITLTVIALFLAVVLAALKISALIGTIAVVGLLVSAELVWGFHLIRPLRARMREARRRDP